MLRQGSKPLGAAAGDQGLWMRSGKMSEVVLIFAMDASRDYIVSLTCVGVEERAVNLDKRQALRVICVKLCRSKCSEHPRGDLHTALDQYTRVGRIRPAPPSRHPLPQWNRAPVPDGVSGGERGPLRTDMQII